MNFTTIDTSLDSGVSPDEETRKKVLKAVEELEYTLNPSVV